MCVGGTLDLEQQKEKAQEDKLLALELTSSIRNTLSESRRDVQIGLF